MQAQFAGVLRDLCVSDEIATEIHQARARGRGRVGVRARGRGRVRVRGRGRARVRVEIAAEIHQAGGVEAIIDAARRHFDSVQVQAAVAGALRNLSELDEVAADIASLGGIETPSEPNPDPNPNPNPNPTPNP